MQLSISNKFCARLNSTPTGIGIAEDARGKLGRLNKICDRDTKLQAEIEERSSAVEKANEALEKENAMDLNKFTERARGFVQAAQTIALREGHQRLAPEHILKALMDDDQGLASNLIKRAGGA